MSAPSSASPKVKKSKKSKTEESSTTSAPAPVVESTPPAVEKPKKMKRKEPSPTDTEPEASAPEDTSAPMDVDEAGPRKEVVAPTVKELQDQRDANNRRRKEVWVEILKLQREIRDLDKSDYQVEASLLREIKKKKKRPISEKTREALSRPMELVPEFCDFLGVEHGTSMPRNDAKKCVYDYLKDNNLRIEKDKRYFFLDDKLQKLFGNPDAPALDDAILKKLDVASTENLCGYFYIQQHLNRLFVKTASKGESDAEEATAGMSARA